jgi:hypothetical protein
MAAQLADDRQPEQHQVFWIGSSSGVDDGITTASVHARNMIATAA